MTAWALMGRPSQVMVKSPVVLLDCCRLAIRAVGLAILMSETRVKFVLLYWS